MKAENQVGIGISGHGVWELNDVNGLTVAKGDFKNLVTQYGDTYYGARASNLASPPAQVTGMQLGTGTTAPAKTGAGAAIVTYISGSSVAIDGTYPQGANQGSGYRITWRTTWAAGTATNTTINEVVLINQSIGTDLGAADNETIARALLNPRPLDKTAALSLTITWHHDLLGA